MIRMTTEIRICLSLLILMICSSLHAGNLALGKPYMVSVIPMDDNSYSDMQGPESFRAVNYLYHGELTDGKTYG
jgi:hypothetical protein